MRFGPPLQRLVRNLQHCLYFPGSRAWGLWLQLFGSSCGPCCSHSCRIRDRKGCCSLWSRQKPASCLAKRQPVLLLELHFSLKLPFSWYFALVKLRQSNNLHVLWRAIFYSLLRFGSPNILPLLWPHRCSFAKSHKSAMQNQRRTQLELMYACSSA